MEEILKKYRNLLIQKNIMSLQKYLIEGQKGGKYSPTSVTNILKKAALKAGSKKSVTPHMLQHSFATHLLRQRFIQMFLKGQLIKFKILLMSFLSEGIEIMVKEKYKQLFLSTRFGGIRTITIHRRCG